VGDSSTVEPRTLTQPLSVKNQSLGSQESVKPTIGDQRLTGGLSNYTRGDLTLRPYQRDAIDRINIAFSAHQGRALFVCHRRKIKNQASEKFDLVGIPHGLIAAGQRMDKEHPLQLALVRSLPRRMEGLDPDPIAYAKARARG
jgi:superfamily II DNA or RNA helicase